MKWKEPETIEELILQTRQQIRAYRAYDAFTHNSCTIAPLSLVVLIPLLLVSVRQSVLLCSFLAVWLGYVVWLFYRNLKLNGDLKRTHKDIGKMVRFLIKHSDLQATGVLIEALNLKSLFILDSELREMIVDNVAFLLDTIDEENADLLDSEARRQLCNLLTNPDPAENFLYVAVLKALVYVGDSDAERMMEKWAVGTYDKENIQILDPALKAERRGEGYRLNSRQMCLMRIQETAEECLPRLYERLRREAVGQTLLRAADPLQGSPRELLRPAFDTLETRSEQLLRAVQDNKKELERK